MKIIHIIPKEKFTSGYIDFMKMAFDFHEHVFVVVGKDTRLDVCDNECIYLIDSPKEIHQRKIKVLLNNADIIIVTGVFNIRYSIMFWGKKIWKKTYLHFWGTDIYAFREAENFISRIKWHIQLQCIKSCKAVITLTNGDYTQMKEIFNVEKKYYVAPMPNSQRQAIDFSNIKKQHNDKMTRIVLGNSATNTNMHMEILEFLSHYKNENIIVYCPLSYGDQDYRTMILERGKELLEDSFVPLLEFMDIQTYYQLLANCDIGIFNNNRQQGMGNIKAMLAMGKRVYLRDTTSMWEKFIKQGYIVHSIKELLSSPFENIVNYREEERLHNIGLYSFEKEFEDAKRLWESVFYDK